MVGGSARRAPANRSAILGGAPAVDLLAVAVATAACWLLAGRLNLLERYLRVTTGLEGWQADELVFVLAGLALGLMWYALRRWGEARRALALHQRAEHRVGELLLHNRELAQQLIAVQDNERRALARELHDELGQSCTAVRAEAAMIERHLAPLVSGASVASVPQAVPWVPPGQASLGPSPQPTAPTDPASAAANAASAASAAIVQARAAARRIESTADALYRCVREMLRRLRPAELDALGLVDAIQALCESWETSSGVACVFHYDGDAAQWSGLSDSVNVTIYRVVQEALSNVMRHAGATQVRIALRRDAAREGSPAALSVHVDDDGRGMDTTAPRSGLGLLGATERAALLGGELSLNSAPGQGLSLCMRLPRVTA